MIDLEEEQAFDAYLERLEEIESRRNTRPSTSMSGSDLCPKCGIRVDEEKLCECVDVLLTRIERDRVTFDEINRMLDDIHVPRWTPSDPPIRSMRKMTLKERLASVFPK